MAKFKGTNHCWHVDEDNDDHYLEVCCNPLCEDKVELTEEHTLYLHELTRIFSIKNSLCPGNDFCSRER